MEKWEYKVIFGSAFFTSKDEKLLNDLGKQGWELTCVSNNILYFKRKLPQ